MTENSDHLAITLHEGNLDTDMSEIVGFVMTKYDGQSDNCVIGTVTQSPPEVSSSAIIDPLCDLDLYKRYITIKRMTQKMTDIMTEACTHVNSTNSSEVSLRAVSQLDFLYTKEGTF